MQTQAEQTPYDITIERFNQAFERRPTFAQGYNYRGVAYGNKVKLTAPLKILTRLLDARKTMPRHTAIAVQLIA